MLQSSEYDPIKYLQWFWHTQDFGKVRNRGSLKKTKAARLILLATYLLALLFIALGIFFIYQWHFHELMGGLEFGIAFLLGYPVIIANLVIVPLFLGKIILISPRNNRKILASEKIFANFKGEKIAIVGSYGKTSMKELLMTVLGDHLKIAATPGNKNVPISHANFAFNLKGDEEILIIEYGEGAPGDVELFARITHPSRAIITGLAPAHLDKYKTLDAAGKDIFSVANFVDENMVMVNNESSETHKYLKPNYKTYDYHQVMGWKIDDIKVKLDGTSFTMTKDNASLKLISHLIGKHHVGVLALVAALAMEFGMSSSEIVSAIAETRPYEHRMQPYKLHNAWVIDDTYNGNIEGMRVGTELLAHLKAKRKIYVTPGLVDQGEENKNVHEKLGELIAKANPDMVVLMKNSVTEHIKTGLHKGQYKKKLIIEDNPLRFYKNLDQFVAEGDLVMMQNDWPDQYK